jgi:hypothetical protein
LSWSGSPLRLVRESREFEPAPRLDDRRVATQVRGAEHRGNGDVVDDVQVRERTRDLVGPRDAHARDPVCVELRDVGAREDELPAVGAVMPAHQVDERRLARAIRSHEAENFAFADVEVHPFERAHAAKRLPDAARDEKPLRSAHTPLARRLGFHRSGRGRRDCRG